MLGRAAEGTPLVTMSNATKFYIVMAYIVMACIVMAYKVMAHKVMAVTAKVVYSYGHK